MLAHNLRPVAEVTTLEIITVQVSPPRRSDDTYYIRRVYGAAFDFAIAIRNTLAEDDWLVDEAHKPPVGSRVEINWFVPPWG
jgi:predicted regulator of amino acid metabolism with ACT domain